MFVAKPTELHWQFPWATPKCTIRKIVKWNWFIVVNSCLRRFCSVSLSYNTCHARICQHADHSEYRPCRLRTFLSYTCLPLHLWLAYIYSKYKIVFNMSESLLFITKEVTGSQHRIGPVMYQSNRSFNIPPPRAYPGHLTSFPAREEGIWLT